MNSKHAKCLSTHHSKSSLILSSSAKGRAPSPQIPGTEVPGPVLDPGLQVAPALTSLPVRWNSLTHLFLQCPAHLCSLYGDN